MRRVAAAALRGAVHFAGIQQPPMVDATPTRRQEERHFAGQRPSGGAGLVRRPLFLAQCAELALATRWRAAYTDLVERF